MSSLTEKISHVRRLAVLEVLDFVLPLAWLKQDSRRLVSPNFSLPGATLSLHKVVSTQHLVYVARYFLPCSLCSSSVSLQNMTEDDWRWHMYDTVSSSSVAHIATSDILCRLKDLTGLEIRMPFTTCAERPRIL